MIHHTMITRNTENGIRYSYIYYYKTGYPDEPIIRNILAFRHTDTYTPDVVYYAVECVNDDGLYVWDEIAHSGHGIISVSQVLSMWEKAIGMTFEKSIEKAERLESYDSSTCGF